MLYEASTLGRIRTLRYRPMILSPRKYENGYLKANFSQGEKRTIHGVHRIIALTFIPNPEGKPCVNHKDNNPLNNKVENLEWVTHQENIAYCVKQNRNAKGERCGSSKLKPSQVIEIRERYPGSSSLSLSRIYGVSPTTILDVYSRKSWKHL